MSDYTGPERRKANHDAATRLGHFLYDRAGLLAFAFLTIFFALGFVAWGVIETNDRTKRQLEEVENLLDINNQIIEFLEDFAVAESEADEGGRAVLANNLRCVASAFVPNPNGGGTIEAPPTLDTIDACFKPTPPAPDPQKVKDHQESSTTTTKGG